MDAPFLRCRAITKSFGDVVAVDHTDLDVGRSELFALLGPSGCGKTTLLRLIAGFEVPDEGEVTLDERTLVGPGTFVPPERRRVAVVFQDFALFPHMNVADNVAFGIPRGRNKKARVGELLELAGLAGLERRMPHELSGGQQQRVALVRALAAEPALILLDEPFSNLDPLVRRRVRADVKALIRASETTALFVTHDQEEALSLAENVAVMFNGRVHQVGTPLEIYTKPADPAVATFIGEPNFLPGTVRDGIAECELGRRHTPSTVSGAARLMLRAEDLAISEAGDIRGTVVSSEYYGHDQLVLVRTESGRVLRVRTDAHTHFAEGAPVALAITGEVFAFAEAE